MSEFMTRDEGLEMGRAVKALRDKVESGDATKQEAKEYTERVDASIKEFDEKIENYNQKLIEEEKKNLELKERIEHVEELRVIAENSNNPEDTFEDVKSVMNAMLANNWTQYITEEKNLHTAERVFKSYPHILDPSSVEKAAVKHANALRGYQMKAETDLLRSDIGEYGGFLCPPEYAAQLEKNIIEYSPIRSYARTRRTGSKVYKVPVRIGIPVATRPGEAKEGGDSISNYTMEDFSPARMTNTTPITEDLLLFEAYDIANELLDDNSQAMSVKEGQEFVDGNGVEQGLGFTVDPNVPEFTTAASGVLDFDDMINVTGELKSGYNPMYFFNRRTMAYLRTLKDGNDRYLWSGPFGDSASGAAATINGYRYSSEFINMDDYDTSGGFPVLFADMPRFFLIVDRTDVSIIRDIYTRKAEAIVEYTMHKWCTGKPFIKEAGIRVKVKA